MDLEEDHFENHGDNSEDEHSDIGLQIVEESPRPKRKPNKDIDETALRVVADVEDDLEVNLEEKAAKTNLSATNVKNLLRQVVTNEHVLALLRHVEHPEENNEPITTFEPKFTRAKSKQLGNAQTNTIPWATIQKPQSEVHALLMEELQEDDSGDEYVPQEQSMELDSSFATTKDDGEEEANIARRTRSKFSLSHTPLEEIEKSFIPPDITTDMYDMDCDDENWADFLKTFTRPLDELTKPTEDEDLELEDEDPTYNILADEENDKAMIQVLTAKLLEKILLGVQIHNSALHTEMGSRSLLLRTKRKEPPEALTRSWNDLFTAEIDKEELRADRAVTVSKKEFNILLSELFDYEDMYDSYQSEEKTKEVEDVDATLHQKSLVPDDPPAVESDPENGPDICIKKNQVPILAQQMRQHVQLLTQNFLLTHEHPEFAENAGIFKQQLLELKSASEGKAASMFHIANLTPAVKLIEDWEMLFASKSKQVEETKQHVAKMIVESMQAKSAGVQHVPTFPPLVLETISKSEVFMYPHLLPRIPFRTSNFHQKGLHSFSNTEDHLIATYLEVLIPLLKQDPFHMHSNNVNMRHVCQYIHNWVMYLIPVAKLEKRIRNRKHPDSEDNPIKFYFQNKKAPAFVHYVCPMETAVAPNRVSPEVLPYQWRQYIHPNYQDTPNLTFCGGGDSSWTQNTPVICIVRPEQFAGCKTIQLPVNSNGANRRIACATSRTSRSTGAVNYSRRRKRGDNSTDSPKSRVRKAIKFSSPVVISVPETTEGMVLPDMPCLGDSQKTTESQSDKLVNKQLNQPASNESDRPDSNELDKRVELDKPVCRELDKPASNELDKPVDYEFDKPACSEASIIDQRQELSFENIARFDLQIFQPGSTSSKGSDSQCSFSGNIQKDNPDEINELMIASCTVKTTKNQPSGAEKKRAKLRREFVANLAMAAPEDPEVECQKEDDFVNAYFEKLRTSLEKEEWEKVIQVLSCFTEPKHAFKDTYMKLHSVLTPKYQELAEEFLLFLTIMQAHEVGQLMPYLMIKDMARFMKKLQIYFKDQPFQIRKIMKCITDLAESTENVNIETIKEAILPLFKGNKVLADFFLQNFPAERPPDYLANGPSEIMEMPKELSKLVSEEICETITVPDTEDPYGGLSCICTCHNVEDQQFKSRLQHCKRCGVKFIQGKIFIQTGKALRPAVVSFLTDPEKDRTKRLSAAERKRSDTSPNKQVSPNKDNHPQEENRNSNNDSEDDCDGTKKKSKRKRKVNAGTSKPGGKARTSKKPELVTSTPKVPRAPRKQAKKRTSPKKRPVQTKPGSSSGQQKRLAPEEPTEIEYTEPPEFVELKVSSDHSGESASEFGESSQEITYTDSDASSTSSTSPLRQQSNESWTREEDRVILQTFQSHSDHEKTFQQVSQLLPNRTMIEIKGRFHRLMSLLHEMSS